MSGVQRVKRAAQPGCGRGNETIKKPNALAKVKGLTPPEGIA